MHILRHPCRLRGSVVRRQSIPRGAADGLEKVGAVGLEASTDLAHHPVGVSRGAAVDVVDDVLPMTELGIDQPIDQRVDLGLYGLRCVRNDLAIESRLERAFVEELWQTVEAHRVVKELGPAKLHAVQNVVDV